jgi:dTDP-4-dehydrorhamnose 3,5-epimerase
MQVRELSLEGLKLISPDIFKDERGYFFESYRQDRYLDYGIDVAFVQDNHSYSYKNTIRGMHFQTFPGQAKLVRVVSGKIFDVAVDIRKGSKTFGRWEGAILDSERSDQLFIPSGFAHGFCVLSEEAHVLYKVSNYYDPETEKGFNYLDPTVGIEWPVTAPILSERDRNAPFFLTVLT